MEGGDVCAALSIGYPTSTLVMVNGLQPKCSLVYTAVNPRRKGREGGMKGANTADLARDP